MQDVAERAGVSVTTVSRALRSSSLVSPETRARVLAAAEELSFAVSRSASSLATGRSGRIGVLVSGRLGAWFNGSILDAIYAHLNARELETALYRINDSVERERFFATLPARRNVDALIVASFALTAAEQTRLAELSMPLVYLNQAVGGAASVSIDDVAGARSGARHLLNLGHRRIAFVRGEGQSGFFYSATLRIRGFRTELAAAGVPEAEQLVLTARSATDGEHVVAQYLSQQELPTALMVESDELALSVMAACWRVGLRTPEDVSVLGFDDHAMAGTFGLSTVAQPVDVLGGEAAAMAVSLVLQRSNRPGPGGTGSPGDARTGSPSTPSPPSPPVVSVPTRLVLRDSTSRPRG